jgi:hypothetical protein
LTCLEVLAAETGCLIRSLLETSHLKRDVIRHPASSSEISRQVKLSAHDCTYTMCCKFLSLKCPQVGIPISVDDVFATVIPLTFVCRRRKRYL